MGHYCLFHERAHLTEGSFNFLRMAGYDGWLAIEHDDVMLSRAEGVQKSVEMLRAVAPQKAGHYKPQEF